AWADRERRTGAPRRAEDQTVADDRCRNDLERVAAHGPELGAARGIVRRDALLAADDQLVAIACVDHDRRAPADRRRAILAPDDGAGARIERGDERADAR